MKIKIGVLPSLITLGNLMAGFAAIGVTAQAQLYWKVNEPEMAFKSFAMAGGLILLAMVFDALDGKVARLANATSEFGAQLDSLCDIVSFGVAPAAIVFLEAASRDLFGHYWYIWVCTVLYATCAALRLARFNVDIVHDREAGVSEEETHMYFRGLPTPAAAGVIASLAIFEWRIEEAAPWAARTMPYACVVLAGLMVSRIRYVHLLNLVFHARASFTYFAAVIFCFFTLLALPLHYEYVLLAGFTGYVLSGPVMFACDHARHRVRVRRRGDDEEDDETALF